MDNQTNDSLPTTAATYGETWDVHWRIAEILLWIITGVAVLLNTLTIIVLCRFSGKLSVHLKFVLNQCVLDLQMAVWNLMGMSSFVSYNLIYMRLFDMFFELICGLIFINLILMTVDHYIAISQPLQYQTLMTHSICKVLIAVMYGLSVVYHVVMLVVLGIHAWKHPITSSFQNWLIILRITYRKIASYQFQVLTGLLAICCCVLIVVYSYITYVVCKTRRGVTISSDAKATRKAATVSFFIITSFIVCFCPYFSANYLWLRVIGPYTWPLLGLNAVLDPIIYAVRLDRVRKGYATMLGKLVSCCKRPQQGDTIEM